MNRNEMMSKVSKSRRSAGKLSNPAMAGALCEAFDLDFETEKAHRKSFVQIEENVTPIQILEPVVDVGEFTK